MSKNKNYTLSVILIAKNEEDRIERCLRSVAPIADEIIVLDSGSTDRTKEIAQQFTRQVVETDWPGYGPQKQRALEKATGDWVLSIDADEELSPELCEEIQETLAAGPSEAGFKLPWAVRIFGATLNHGRSGRAPLRLFRRTGARFTDALVHETIVLPKGKIKTLKGRLFHYTSRDFGHYLEKNRQYAWLGARQRHEKGKKGLGLTGAALRAIWTFFLIYVIRLGFLDGRVGFLVAVMYGQSSFNKYAGLWTLRQVGASENKSEQP
ncbi:MAG: glycosyltransferase family 2 protein [Desulfobacteraceae bacterium]|nr:MAG: glycosyltransferase family 2 protein [Desulfobacteraceae bacterium]